MCWELCNVEEAFESGIFVTVVFVMVNSVFVTSLVVVSSPLTVAVNEECVGCKDVLESFLLVVPIDVPIVDSITRFDIVVGFGTDVFVGEIVAVGNT